MSKVGVLGGQINYPVLTHKLPGEEYAKAKAHMWIHMLNDGNKPKKWLKPNGKGTKVNFERIHTKEEYLNGLDELSLYLTQINREFGLDYKVKVPE
ncbi:MULTISPECIES: hypothetical protein [unclassified Psychrobacillus]|uniref:hypothetical protein n=1 Tax=unclassified Psychrobacillus TaxID=2636677 RepID=UPI0030F8A339